MKGFNWAAAAVVPLLSLSVAQAHAQVVTTGGAVTINASGFFKTPVSQGGSVKCTGIVFLVPSNSGAVSSIPLSSLIMTGTETASSVATAANGGITNNGGDFACTIVVPYRFENVNLSTTYMAIAYTMNGTDPGYWDPTCLQSPPGNNPLACFTPGTSPGKKQQVIEVIPIPATGGSQTSLSVNPKL